jgi:hypothetical protein
VIVSITTYSVVAVLLLLPQDRKNRNVRAYRAEIEEFFMKFVELLNR